MPSNFYTPHNPGQYTALDSAYFRDGMAMDAHGASTLIGNAVHMYATGPQLLALAWPRQDPGVSGNDSPVGADSHQLYGTWADGFRTWVPSGWWIPLLPPVPFAKAPGFNRATAKVEARVTADHQIMLQIATRARPFSDSAGPFSPNVIMLVGDGDDDVDDYTRNHMWLDPSREERVQLWAKAFPTDDAPFADGSTPQARVTLPSTVFWLTHDRLYYSSGSPPSWNSPGWGRTGAEIEFSDDNGNVVARRSILDVANDNRSLGLWPHLSQAEVVQARTGDDWRIFAAPNLSLMGVSLGAEDLVQ